MHAVDGLLGNLTISLVLATVLGVLCVRIKLSPIVGYLAAGIILGPQTPGFVANTETASDLAEVGVVLLMFGVGLHFNLKDLLAVRRIAFPGAIGQFAVATSVVLIVTWISGIPLVYGAVLGAAVSIASTVVVTRVLIESDQINTATGHITIGWLIAQDIFTVLVLVAMPAVGHILSDGVQGTLNLIWALFEAIFRVAVLCFVIAAVGPRAIPWLLQRVTRTRSRELFTLTILALALAIAVGSALIFGVSVALGAFLAGMVVGQTEASHQAAADALPMRDAFAVLFFVSVGMLFDPTVFVESPGLLTVILGILLIVNPMTAFFMAWFLRYSPSTAINIALLLSQIGEFSFLLADQAVQHKMLSDEIRSVLVACSIIAIALNPMLYRLRHPLENVLRRFPRLWKRLSLRSENEGFLLNQETHVKITKDEPTSENPRAIIVGYGPVGQTASRLLTECGIRPVIIDLNLDTIRQLMDEGVDAIYGDAGNTEILEAASIRSAKYLLVTIPEMLSRSLIILSAKNMNPELRVFVRARYIQDRVWLEEVGANGVVTEEGETAVSLAVMLLEEMGSDKNQIRKETRRIQNELKLRGHGHAEPAPRNDSTESN